MPEEDEEECIGCIDEFLQNAEKMVCEKLDTPEKQELCKKIIKKYLEKQEFELNELLKEIDEKLGKDLEDITIQ